MNELSNKPLAQMPDFTENDTKSGGKAHYGQIVARFQEEDCSKLKNLVHLIDTIDQMSPEIYEHYRSLQDLFREHIRRLLESIRRPDGSYQAGTEKELEQLTYCIKKACADGTLLREKYQDLRIIK
ncbi:MAG: hypothetical protein HFG49_04290 [Lachnospiraceae bacterium]|jgi:hypothetical protein|nr:hypothetical protein [Lachnospiraceae bacterium]